MNNDAWSRLSIPALMVATTLLAACGDKQGTPAPALPAATERPAQLFKPSAGIQDIMAYMIDPAADFLWESVSTTVSKKGVDEKQPRTDQDWNQVRRQAIILAEASNLILMEGRHVTREGEHLEDHGTPGNLTAEESDRAIAADRASFVAFAQALHGVGESMLTSADARNPQGLLDAGDAMDKVCEGCHLKFWYPGQKIPVFPDQAPEVDQ
jgi:cytochrome c556